MSKDTLVATRAKALLCTPCRLLYTPPCSCPLLSALVCSCPHFSALLCSCPLLSALVCCCPLLYVVVPSRAHLGAPYRFAVSSSQVHEGGCCTQSQCWSAIHAHHHQSPARFGACPRIDCRDYPPPDASARLKVVVESRSALQITSWLYLALH